MADPDGKDNVPAAVPADPGLADYSSGVNALQAAQDALQPAQDAANARAASNQQLADDIDDFVNDVIDPAVAAVDTGPMQPSAPPQFGPAPEPFTDDSAFGAAVGWMANPGSAPAPPPDPKIANPVDDLTFFGDGAAPQPAPTPMPDPATAIDAITDAGVASAPLPDPTAHLGDFGGDALSPGVDFSHVDVDLGTGLTIDVTSDATTDHGIDPGDAGGHHGH